MSVFAAMNPRGRIVLAVSALAVLAVAFMLFRIASQPSFTTIASGLDPSTTGQMTAALDAQGVAYRLENNGTALAVDKGKTAQAQIALASKGLNGRRQPGFELLDKQKLGASNFQQQVAYQRALEGQVAQTISQISGVSGAQVQLTMPQDQLFADEQKPATAAVLLGGGATTLESGAVRGIANLVASSVPNLKASNVTITDGTGLLLWPSGDGSSTGAMSKPAAEARYNLELQSTLSALVTRTLGAGKGQVQVSSDLQVDDATTEQLHYAKKGVPTKTTSDVETLDGTGASGAGGAAGAAGNIPGYAAGASGAGSKSNYKHTVKTQETAVDKTITRTKIAPGKINRLNVALVLDKSVKKQDADAIKAAVATAAGLDAKRGDSIKMTQVKFAPAPPAAKPAGLPIPPAFAGILKVLGVGFLAALFLFFVTRQIKKREGEELADPSWLRQIDPAPRRVAELEAPATPQQQSDAEAARWALEDVVKREPERVAQQLKTWMAEDG